MVVGAGTHMDTLGDSTGVPDRTRHHHVLGGEHIMKDPYDDGDYGECDCDACNPSDEDESDYDIPASGPRYSSRGKGTCQRCDERQPLDDLTLCFHTRSINGVVKPHLKVVCLACRKDTEIWQPWSHKVPRCV